MSDEIADLIRLWNRLLPNVPLPSVVQFELWRSMHSPNTLRAAIIETSKKSLRLERDMDLDFAVRFTSKVANTRQREAAL